MYIVGTPWNTLTRWRWIVSSTARASNRGTIVRQAPAATEAFSPQVWPNEWNSGSAPSTTSPAASENGPAEISALRIRLAWVSSAPLGVPVVPDV